MYRLILVFTVYAAGGLLLSGCEGPAGPEGPRGPAGAANVQVEEFTVSSDEFSGDGNNYTLSRSMDMITPAVVDSGTVVAYTDLGTDVWAALPLTLTAQGNVANVTYAYDDGQFGLILTAELDGDYSTVLDGYAFKVVVIPPAESDVAARVDLDDHDSVMRAFGISSVEQPAR